MELHFLYHPVADLEETVAFYRSVLGWEEAWRMEDSTVAMAIPGSDVAVMLDAANDPAGPSGFFQVDDVDAFYQENLGRIDFTHEPAESDPVRFVSFRDPGGNLVRVFSDSADSSQ